MERGERLLSERKWTGTHLRADIVPEAERKVWEHRTKGAKLKITHKPALLFGRQAKSLLPRIVIWCKMWFGGKIT